MLFGVLLLAGSHPVAGARAEAPADSLAPVVAAAQADSSAALETARADSAAIHWQPPTTAGRPDLLLHASLSFALGLGVGLVTEEPAAAASVSISLGIAKEIMDPRFDKTDLVADVIGAGLAALVTHWLTP